MRLFIAVKIPDAVLSQVAELIDKGSGIKGIRWTPKDSLHITLKFLGEVEEEKTGVIASVLKEVADSKASFSLALRSGGVFPHRRHPRVFWAGTEGDIEKLKAMAGQIEDRLVPHGFPAENRAFKAHLTVGRIKHNYQDGMTAADQFCTLFSTLKSSSFDVKDIHLIRSHLQPQGACYEALTTFPFRT